MDNCETAATFCYSIERVQKTETERERERESKRKMRSDQENEQKWQYFPFDDRLFEI